jgi:hypothetical protein
MQILEHPQQLKRVFTPDSGSHASLHAMTLTALSQPHGTGYSREFIRESVMSWAARKWPELLVGRDACAIGFAAHSPSGSVQVTCADEDEYVWAFKRIGADDSGRLWETCILILGGRDHDLLTVRTGFVGSTPATPCTAQPEFLYSLVEHLPFEDGGYPLITQPRQVFSLAAFNNFRDHLFNRRRTLPILAVASAEKSQVDAPPAASPAVLARALCGVAHVVSLGEVGASRLENCLGPRMAVRAGQARLFMPGFADDADPDMHPAFAERRAPPRLEASYVEAAAQRATHSWSTSVARRADFDLLWTKSARA